MAEQVFWASPNSEPKRGFRFLVRINSIPSWMCKKVTKPEFVIKNVQHRYLNHSFSYPGGAEWSPITVEMVDPVNPDASKTLQNIIKNSGYNFPTNPNDTTTLSKAKSCAALGHVVIEQIGANGEPIEQWTLNNAWVEKVSYGELSYESEELTTVTLSIRYDYATIDMNIGGSMVASGDA